MISKGLLRSFRRHVYFVLLTKVKLNQCFCGMRKKRQKYLHSLVYDSGNKTAAMGFELTLKKKKKNQFIVTHRLDVIYWGWAHFLNFCVLNVSPAAHLVRFVLWGEGRAWTQSAPQWVQLSSPDLTAGSRNSELDLQDGSPIKKTNKQ